MPQRRHVASQQRHAMPWRFCDLPKYPAALTTTATDSSPPLRSGISGHRSSSHFRALLSAAPSPEMLIPPLSLPLPRLPSHVHSNTCCERPTSLSPIHLPGYEYERRHRQRRRRRRRRRWVGQCACGCCAPRGRRACRSRVACSTEIKTQFVVSRFPFVFCRFFSWCAFGG